MCNFLSSNFSNVQIPKQQLLECAISQAATNQIYIVGQASEAPKAAMGADHCGQGSCRLGRWTFEKLPLGKILSKSCRLGKCLLAISVHYLDIPHSGSWCNQSCALPGYSTLWLLVQPVLSSLLQRINLSPSQLRRFTAGVHKRFTTWILNNKLF